MVGDVAHVVPTSFFVESYTYKYGTVHTVCDQQCFRGIKNENYLTKLNLDSTGSYLVIRVSKSFAAYFYCNCILSQILMEIGYVFNLTTLAIAENHLGGTLPTHLKKLVTLRILALEKDDLDNPGIS